MNEKETKNLTYVSIDIETCGLDKQNHDVVEITAKIDNLNDIKPVSELPTFHYYVKKKNYFGSPHALAMHADKFKKISISDDDCISEENVALALYRFIDLHKAYVREEPPNENDSNMARLVIVPAGKNFGTFDMIFLNRLPDFENLIGFTHRVIDVGNMYLKIEDVSPPSLNKCANRANVNMEVTHDSTNEVDMVIHCIRKFLGVKI